MSGPETQDSDPLADIRNLGPIQCGEEAAKHFLFDPGYQNLNHGSYRRYPIAIRNVFRHYQERSEARSDTFIRYEYRTTLLKESREAIARYLHAPVETCVYVPNASTGVDTVLRNLIFEPGDVVVYFDTLYGAFDNTVQHIAETTPVEVKKVEFIYPVSNQYLCDAFEATIKDLRAKCKNPRIAIFDTISSTPGVRMPFERLTKLCWSYNVLSCIDGAHRAGHIPLHLEDLDPDFFVSNCHKWLYVPRGCAVLYVPIRNQHLLRATLPTGYGFVPLSREVEAREALPVPGKNDFVANFAYVGTKDDTPYLCVPAALEWRSKLEWEGRRGEEAIIAYMHELARKGGQTVAAILGTEVLDNEEDSLGKCSFTNVRLPLSVSNVTKGNPATAEEIGQWIMKKMTFEYQTAVYVFLYADVWWTRLSAQVYLTLRDFDCAGRKLKAACESVNWGDWEKDRSAALG